MKHTPGPWIVDGKVIRTQYGGQVCMFSGMIRQTRDDIEANAKLISAAPDLLKSLNEMVEMMDGGDEHGAGSAWHIKAKVAVAKATL